MGGMRPVSVDAWPPLEAIEPTDGVYTPRQLRLLSDLETIVLTEGFRDLTVAVLAERLHCSRRSLYELAESKEALVLLVIDRLLRRVAKRAEAAMEVETTHVNRLRAFLTEGVVELHRATHAYSQDVADEPSAQALVDKHFRFATHVVERMIADGIAAGEFGPVHPHLAAQLLDAGLARMQQPEVLKAAGVTLAEALEEFLTLFADGIRMPGKTATRRSDKHP
jgi:AcrR family transcriptional regulator